MRGAIGGSYAGHGAYRRVGGGAGATGRLLLRGGSQTCSGEGCGRVGGGTVEGREPGGAVRFTKLFLPLAPRSPLFLDQGLGVGV